MTKIDVQLTNATVEAFAERIRRSQFSRNKIEGLCTTFIWYLEAQRNRVSSHRAFRENSLNAIVLSVLCAFASYLSLSTFALITGILTYSIVVYAFSFLSARIATKVETTYLECLMNELGTTCDDVEE